MQWAAPAAADRSPAALLASSLRMQASRLAEVRPTHIAFVIVALALLVRLSLLFAPGDLNPDTPLYLAIAQKLSFGSDSVRFDTLRTPGYPLFVAPLRFFPGPWRDAIVVSHHLLGVALAAAATWAGWRYFGRAVGVMAGFAVAISPLLLTAESSLTPDLVFAVFLFAVALVLAEAVRRNEPDMRLLAAAGAIAGIAAYVKPAALALAIAAVLPLAVATRSWRVTLRGTFVFALTMAVLVLPWFVRNGVLYDKFTMSTVGGVTRFSRVFDEDRTPISTSTREGVLVKRVRDRVLRESKPRPINTEWLVHDRLARLGYSHEEIAAIQGRLANDAIKAHPVTYIRGTLKNLFNNVRYAKDAKSVLGVGVIEGRRERSRLKLPLSLDTRAWSLGNLYTRALWVLSLNALLCLVLLFVGHRRQRAAAAALGSVVFLITLTSSLTFRPEARYIGEVAPLIWLLESAAAVVVISALARRISSRKAA
jgi:dolichyl-phosphate-mannose-protein mannosyltransferase